VCWVNNVMIKCENPNITYEQSMKDLDLKSINYNNVYHIQPKLDEKKFKQKDYTFPFMTQVVIRYENIDTKEQSVFMSYIIQKLVKFENLRKRDKKTLDNEDTLKSVATFLQAEDLMYSI
jgi:hypothetical protein